jgi:hypothetical protein
MSGKELAEFRVGVVTREGKRREGRRREENMRNSHWDFWDID